MPDFFDNIDAVFVINLDRRKDRWIDFQRRWKDIIPHDKLVRSSAVVGLELEGYGEPPWFTDRTGERSESWAGAAGCVLSHKRVIREAQKRGLSYVMILEDDAMPSEAMLTGDYDRTFEKFFSKVPEWGMLYLGFNKMPSFGTPIVENRSRIDIWRIPGALTTHAYLVHKNAYTSLLRSLPEEESVWKWIAKYRAIDTWYREFFEGATRLPIYAVFPRLVVQEDGPSDIAVHHKDTRHHTDIHQLPSRTSARGYRLRNALRKPFCWLKNRLNSMRTHSRARKKGLPGIRKGK